MMNAILETIGGLLATALMCLWQIFDRLMTRLWAPMFATTLFLLIVVLYAPAPDHKPTPASAPVAAPVPPAPAATVLYPPGYTGPDLYGAAQPK